MSLGTFPLPASAVLVFPPPSDTAEEEEVDVVSCIGAPPPPPPRLVDGSSSVGEETGLEPLILPPPLPAAPAPVEKVCPELLTDTEGEM